MTVCDQCMRPVEPRRELGDAIYCTITGKYGAVCEVDRELYLSAHPATAEYASVWTEAVR